MVSALEPEMLQELMRGAKLQSCKLLLVLHRLLLPLLLSMHQGRGRSAANAHDICKRR